MKRSNHARKLFFLTVMIVFLAISSLAKAAPPVLQTQYGPDGIEVDLIRCKVSDNVLSVAFLVRSTTEKSVSVDFDIEAVHYLANNKKYHVLKDEKGNWLSGPQNLRGGGSRIYLESSKDSKIVWYKFPAPPEDVKKIQINSDEIMPFDDVEVQR
ncbi:MAG: hypothetical protein CSA35_06710 [Dethiosulfovibrio peptidovorans]|nr:MAG: hypothetical protein CSA35_06710 [Dethiosulfovibrio peptidovorans]